MTKDEAEQKIFEESHNLDFQFIPWSNEKVLRLVLDVLEQVNIAQGEIADLRAERDKLQAVQDEQDAILRGVGPITCIGGVEHPVAKHGDCLYCARDSAYVRGLERALEVAQPFGGYGVRDSIVAEIDKAKAKK